MDTESIILTPQLKEEILKFCFRNADLYKTVEETDSLAAESVLVPDTLDSLAGYQREVRARV